MSVCENKYVIARMDGRVVSALLRGTKAVEIHCDEEKNDSILGDIYVGRIKNIAWNIGAAFVSISPEIVCYLPLDEIRHPVYTKKGSSEKLQAGDELLVQVSREAVKTKAPSVTTNLTLHGKYALLTSGNRQISVSSKLPREEKNRLLALVTPYFEEESAADDLAGSDEGKALAREQDGEKIRTQGQDTRLYGWLLRTNAGGAPKELLRGDILRLKREFAGLMEKARYRTCYSCLFHEPPAWLARLRDLYETEAEQIITDDGELYGQIRAYLQENQPEDLKKLSFYKDDLLPMCRLYSLNEQISQALQERVWLKSGGYLVIQPTEALTVVDVNTGKYEGGRKKEETFLKINLEAAAETARQIRLRNLSGIILVDFINMESDMSTKKLLTFLGEELKKDPVRTVLVDMTKLSLVEITRHRKERTLMEALGRKL